MPQVTSIERQGSTAVVHVHGDVVVRTVRSLHGVLRSLQRRRGVKKVVVDFADAGRLDSSAVAVIEIARRTLRRAGKQLDLTQLGDRHRAALELAPTAATKPSPVDAPGWLERFGERVVVGWRAARELIGLVVETLRQGWLIASRRARLPKGAVTSHALAMGADAVFIVGMLSFLLGMTLAFQGAVQLRRFGADVFVADMVSMSMVREFAPMMTAIMLTGRTGAAIAAELGTMRVGSEIDALTAMGINPVRYLVVPRLTALTLVQPALTIMGMFIGIAGGMFVAAMVFGMSPLTFWLRTVQRVTLGDFAHGVGKSFVFAWIIGIAGTHLGLRATRDASSVGTATTRTVVVAIFCIIMVDAVFATIVTLGGP